MNKLSKWQELKRLVNGMAADEKLGLLTIKENKHEDIPLYDPSEKVNTEIRSNPAIGEITRYDPLTKEDHPDLPAGYVIYRDLDSRHVYLQRIDNTQLRRLVEVQDPFGELGYNFPDPATYPWAVRKKV